MIKGTDYVDGYTSIIEEVWPIFVKRIDVYLDFTSAILAKFDQPMVSGRCPIMIRWSSRSYQPESRHIEPAASLTIDDLSIVRPPTLVSGMQRRPKIMRSKSKCSDLSIKLPIE